MYKRIGIVIFAVITIGVFSLTNVSAQETRPNVPITEVIFGTIKDIKQQPSPEGLEIDIKDFYVEITEDGEKKIVVSQISTLPDFQVAEYKIGDKVTLNKITTPSGEISYHVTDHVRITPMIVLGIIFIILTVLVAKKKGLFSILGLIISFAVIFKFILPSILNGDNPLLIAIIGAMIIIPLNFFLAHGLNRKTMYATAGTILTLIITGLISVFFVNWAHLSGYTSDEAGFLQAMTGGAINIRDLLLAGIIIGVLGILDDITIAQSGIVRQLKGAKENIKFDELFFRAMEVGKDHIASLVNTLILVYASASMPLLLLFMDINSPIMETINREVVAQEIIQTLIASIGLIIAVPITTFIAAYFTNKEKNVEVDEHEGHHH